MKKYYKLFYIALLSMAGYSCDSILEVDEESDPNNPSLNALQSGASIEQIQQLATGVLDGMRDGIF
ncbi:MAG: hypothetical protein AAF901_05680, partial [Bacteroidota bacterium]